MGHIPALISDLALILITAGAVSILFKWLKQPVVLGYIVAGFLISPHFVLPHVADVENIYTWAEIGVIFLLFALGLEFSFKKLMNVGGTATIATTINMGSMIAIGYIIGQIMSLTSIESLFLGGMLSMSSTTIIIKAFNDMELQKKRFAGIVFGMLIVEDLAAILMMVLLSTIAVSKHFQGIELFESGLKLIFFMVVWFVVGIILIPTLLKKLKQYLNDEILLVVTVGLCLGMVIFADAVGFSAALGAFIMGSILAETVESKHIEHLIEPLKNLFGAVFFVSVGMMIVPQIVIAYIVPIIILTLVVLIGRVIFASIGVLASGEGMKVSIRSGFSLAQIGEFSFIIATLGMQLGVISDFMYPVIVAVSVITTFTTPYLIKLSNPVYDIVERMIPQKWNILITGYSTYMGSNVSRQSDWKKLLQSVLVSITIYFVIALAIILLSKKFLEPFIMERIPSVWGAILTAVITLILVAPSMGVIVRSRGRSPEAKRLWADSHFNKALLITLNLLRFTLCITLIAFILIPLFPRAMAPLITISTIIAIIISLWQGFRKNSRMLEAHFFNNLKNKELSEVKNNRSAISHLREILQEKDIHIEEYEISPNSRKVGKTLIELNFRQATGVNLVLIVRGKKKIVPAGETILYPYDKIIVAGSDAELQRFANYLERNRNEDDKAFSDEQYQIQLFMYEVEQSSAFIGKSIKELDFRNKTGCVVTAIEREDSVITNFDSSFIIREGDTIIVAGERHNMEALSAMS